MRRTPVSKNEISLGMPAIPLMSLALINEQLLLLGIAVFLWQIFSDFGLFKRTALIFRRSVGIKVNYLLPQILYIHSSKETCNMNEV